ncbi:hypothetical protein ceV_081 [Chrysochromulina ericina virus CeV-01B]|jgi:hypothetical protein|uniref:Uncharacterized protein n=1 Tax=Chrysochromulina ericina virus CeV-01B TaxID=3070830 RepID=A0A0N9QIV4_9VIRU|nr:hypothetical protein ceV_081 [Chrysochromulina ericina virus]ALH22987.1 hypothetical protein ceV_081 [Chrysochromulina ericina virus CeV-01B]|tara:strand:- start:6606 stop:7016 length:411 start_codon:yes stop_codon:yes gene_type:complete
MIDIIEHLPNDILDIIFYYVNPREKIFLNKKYYIKYNSYIDTYIYNYSSYIRDIIRFDCSFVFEHIIYRNLNKWIKINNYNYGKVIYYNYIYFLSDFSNKNKATKCLYLLNLHLEISKLKKLNCKDYRIKHKEWIA